MPSVYAVMRIDVEDDNGQDRESFEVVEIAEGDPIPEGHTSSAFVLALYRVRAAAMERCTTEAAQSQRACSQTLAKRRPISGFTLQSFFDEADGEDRREHEARIQR